MSQIEKAKLLAKLHQKGKPVVLYNIWDAGGAKALEEAGATAIATGSWSMAASQGYGDGEQIPLDFVTRIVERICASVDVPVTVDIEGGYASEPEEVAENLRHILRAGAVGINLEDRIVKGDGLHPISTQTARIRAIKAVASDEGVPLVLNGRTDLFLGSEPSSHQAYIQEAMEREAAYAEAGADCFFVPGLTDTTLISQVTENSVLPINVMMLGDLRSIDEMASLGVSRVSYGPGPFLKSAANLKNAYASIQ